MRDSKFVAIAAGLVTVGAWSALWFIEGSGFGPSFNPKPHEATGWVMARQALDLLKPGGQILVITRDTAAFKNPASEAQLAGFKDVLAKQHVSVFKTLALQVDPLRPVEVPAGDFFELIRKAQPGTVIVSFMGPPSLSEGQLKQLGDSKPKIVAFCSGNSPDRGELKALFDQGLLQAAVVSKRSPNRGAFAPKDLQAWFDQYYQAVTASTMGNLALGADGNGGLE